MGKFVFIFVIAALFGHIQGAKLPSYIMPCKQSDPNANDCIIKEGNRIISTIVHGDKKYKIPNLMPFKVDSIVIQPSEMLKLELINTDIFGFEDAKIIGNEIDFDKHTWEMSIRIPNCQLIGDYKISGQLLILPITGNGKSNITLEDTVFTYHMDYELKEKNDAQHAVILNRYTKHTPKRVYYKFENLFNGNKLLAEEMDKFLNDNWKEVSEELAEGADEIISTIASSIINQFYKIVPFNEVFTH